MLAYIERTRDGLRLTREEIQDLVAGVVDGRWPDYQLAAWLMAAYLRGLGEQEVVDLTEAMAWTGSGNQENALGEVDKHSTGGVGDKTTLAVAPLVASLGIRVAKMSGRGLGHTGGTLDKLESIPGFRVTLTREEVRAQVERVGVAVVAQSAELAPADGRLYALRDVTGTVDSIPLIASSVMSKKLAAGAPCLVLDVKVGRGAFMATLERARELASLMIRIGEAHGRRVHALITSMDQPLGYAVGNAVEVNEAAACLRGQGPQDLRQEVVELATHMVALARKWELAYAHEQVEQALATGKAYETFLQWIQAQGGDAQAVENGLPLAPARLKVRAEREGWVASVDALTVGQVVLRLGAGRERLGDPVHHGVGVQLSVKVGDYVSSGGELATVYAQQEDQAQGAARLLRQAIVLADAPVTVAPPVLEALGSGGGRIEPLLG
jgi:pyrimidine-nucleoside phosphorylase